MDKFFIIVFKIQSNTNVEIYVQKEIIKTWIHKAEVLFRGCKSYYWETPESQNSAGFHPSNTLNVIIFSTKVTSTVHTVYL